MKNLLTFYQKKINISDSWNVKILTSKVLFYKLNSDADIVSIENQISINTDLTVKIFAKGNELPSELPFKELKWILNFDMKLNRWSQVQNLLDRFKCTYYYASSEQDFHSKLIFVCFLMYLQPVTVLLFLLYLFDLIK